MAENERNGDITVFPVMEIQVRIAAASAILLGLRVARSPEALKTGGELLQMALTPQQALYLTREVEAAAKRILAQRPDGLAN